MQINLKVSADEYMELGSLAAQHRFFSVESLFQTLADFMVEVSRSRKELPDCEYRGTVN